MKIIATKDEKLNMVYEALTTGLPYFGDYGLILDYNQEEYATAKRQLLAKTNDTVCLEDVWKQMLRNGNTLTFKDTENNDEPFVLNMDSIKKNWGKVPMRVVNPFVTENYDAEDADQLIQYLLFGELVYG